MKVLLAGKTSYIGRAVEALLQKEGHSVCAISVRDDGWKEMELSGFDAVVFAAAIVHRKDATEEEYFRVNARLPYEFAQKAKAQGVKQFLFLSTAAVYGAEKGLPGNVIGENTPLRPVSLYGQSKLEGERLLQTLSGDGFAVSVVRPMNVYGKNCPGNYIRAFVKLVRLLPVLPKAFDEAKQGLVYIDNLSALCAGILRDGRGGVYHAQDRDPISSCGLMAAIAAGLGKKRKFLPCGWLLKPLRKLSPVVKLYGGVCYSEAIVADLEENQAVDTTEGLKTAVL